MVAVYSCFSLLRHLVSTMWQAWSDKLQGTIQVNHADKKMQPHAPWAGSSRFMSSWCMWPYLVIQILPINFQDVDKQKRADHLMPPPLSAFPACSPDSFSFSLFLPPPSPHLLSVQVQWPWELLNQFLGTLQKRDQMANQDIATGRAGLTEVRSCMILVRYQLSHLHNGILVLLCTLYLLKGTKLRVVYFHDTWI